MNNKAFFEHLALLAMEEEINELAKYDASPSKELDKRIKKLLAEDIKTSKTSEYKYKNLNRNITGKGIIRVLAAVITAVILLSISVTAVYAQREKGGSFLLSEDRENVTLAENSSDSSSDKAKIEMLLLPEIPENYVLTNRFCEDYLYSEEYKYKDDVICFSQSLYSTDEYIELNLKNINKIQIDSVEYIYYKIGENTTVLWGERGYSFRLTSTKTEHEALIALAQTLRYVSLEEGGVR